MGSFYTLLNMIMMQSIVTIFNSNAVSCGTKQLTGIPTEEHAVLLYVTDFFPCVV